MEREEKILKIKQELRTLRKLNHSIDSAVRTKERYERRKEFIKQLRGKEEEKKKKLQRVDELINKLELDRLIDEVTHRESLYMDAISKLEPHDMTIILECYVNGRTYRDMGYYLGYTEVAIRKKVSKIIENLATMM